MDRFGRVLVHTGLQAPLSVALQRVSGHRNDRHVMATGFLRPANRSRRLQAVHLWHLNVHQDHIEVLGLQGSETFQPVVGDDNVVSLFCQYCNCQFLIDETVFDQEDPVRIATTSRFDCQGLGAGPG